MNKQAAWAISNACKRGSTLQVRRMVETGAMISLVRMLEESDAELKVSLLSALHRILECDDDANALSTHFEALNGLRTVESLQQHENVAVYNAAVQILRDFYDVVEVR